MARRGGPNIPNRRALFDYLETQMSRAYRQVLDVRRLEYESTYVKTFLLEFDWEVARSSLNLTRESEVLQAALSVGERSGAAIETTVEDTEEAGFYRVRWRGGRNLDLDLYLDTSSDPERRFWIAYTLSDSREVETLLDRLASSRPALDRVWFWPSFLSALQEKGEFRGIGLDYDYRRFEKAAGVNDPATYLKMQVWGGPESRRILEFLDGDKELADKAVLSKVRLKYWPEDRSRFCLEDVKYNGKFTARGSSFDAHQFLVVSARDDYASRVRQLETEYAIRWGGGDAEAAFEGDAIFVVSEIGGNWIQDLDLFSEVVFSGTEPFRLWGVPSSISGGDGLVVRAVDLHTGSKIFFELYPDAVGLYLDETACGNTVARFLTNVQHTFRRQVLLEDNSGNRIL
jgi:hypothetical protein